MAKALDGELTAKTLWLTASSSGDGLRLVERKQRRAVGGADGMALDLEGWRHLAVGGGERLLRDDEAADPLDRGEPLIDPRDRRADRLLELAVAGQRDKRVGVAPVRFGKAGKELAVGHDDGDEIGAAVAENHRLGDLRLERQVSLDARRRDHVAARVLDEIALAVGDLEVALAVELADIAGMQPAILQRARGRLRVVPIAPHDELTAHQYLAVLGDAHLDPGERRANRIDPHLAGRIAANDRRRLGLDVALHQIEAEGDEEAADLGIERRAARDQRLQPAAEARADLVAHELVEDEVGDSLDDAQAGRIVVALDAELERMAEQ